MIRLDEVLDRESQNSHVLTVLAKNRGSARGYNIDEAQVKIQVNLSEHIKKRERALHVSYLMLKLFETAKVTLQTRFGH